MTTLRDIQLTILVDNVSDRDDLKAEHGFSCLVEADGHRILFDTGAKDALVQNSRCLGIGLSGLDALVFSHGHYDHTGGLAAAIELLGRTRVVAHPNILGSHRSQRTGSDRDIGMPAAAVAALNGLRCEYARTSVEVADGIWTTGEIPRRTSDVHPNGLCIDEQGLQPDPLPDDMALVLRHRAGLVVLLGCAHAGVVDTLAWIEQLFPGEPLLGLAGGMHLDGAAPETIQVVVSTLRSSPVLFVAPGHCTGSAARQAVLASFGYRCRPLCVGMEMHINGDGRLEGLECLA
jgi:7,8-dihydropterin-6-yl-methyl-4-(beta-D-ribofuranosyl)aminobenzene 5'-phosphate synthase